MNTKEILIISLIIFLSIFAWVLMDIYHNSITSTITKKQEEQIKPLTPKFDNAIIEGLKKREK